MRIIDVLAVPVQAGFFFDDQLAIRAGAAHDGFDYTGEPLTAGFRRVRQPGEAVSVLLLLDDGGVEFGDCAAVQYSGAGGRDPLFAARDAAAAVEAVVAPALRGTDLADGFRTVSARIDALTAGPDDRPLPAAVRYGVSQAVLAAVARDRRQTMAEVIRDEYETGAPLVPVPLYAQSGDDRYGNAEKMIIKGVDVLPHGLINNVAEKFGPSGEIFADYAALAGRPDPRPRPVCPGTGPGSTSTCTGAPGSRSTATSTRSPPTWPSSPRSRTPMTSRSSTRSTPGRATPRSRPTAPSAPH